jgi:hypothetical protein
VDYLVYRLAFGVDVFPFLGERVGERWEIKKKINGLWRHKHGEEVKIYHIAHIGT